MSRHVVEATQLYSLAKQPFDRILYDNFSFVVFFFSFQFDFEMNFVSYFDLLWIFLCLFFLKKGILTRITNSTSMLSKKLRQLWNYFFCDKKNDKKKWNEKSKFLKSRDVLINSGTASVASLLNYDQTVKNDVNTKRQPKRVRITQIKTLYRLRAHIFCAQNQTIFLCRDAFVENTLYQRHILSALHRPMAVNESVTKKVLRMRWTQRFASLAVAIFFFISFVLDVHCVVNVYNCDLRLTCHTFLSHAYTWNGQTRMKTNKKLKWKKYRKWH